MSEPARPSRAVLLLLALSLCWPAAWGDPLADSASGRNLYNQGKYSAAAATLEKLHAAGLANAADLAVLGLCYTNLAKLEAAQRVLEIAKALGPANSLVYIALGTLSFTRQDFEQAAGHFSRAARLAPGSPQARNGLVASLVNRGVVLFQSGKTSEARKAFQNALSEDPRAAQALRNLGILELQEGNPGRASELFEQALTLLPEEPQLLELLITALEPQQDQAKLLQAYTRLTKALPANAQAFASLGILLENQGRRQEAGRAFERAEELGTEEPFPYLHLARLSIAGGDRQEAGRLLRQAIGKAIQKAGLLQAQAARKVKESQGTLAPGDLTELAGLSRLVEEPRQILQESLLLLRCLYSSRPQDFETDLLDLSSWYPQNVDLRVALGQFYQEQGRWVDALGLWEMLLEKHPAVVEAHLGLALCLERSGRLQDASTAYLRGLDLAPGNVEVYDGLESVYRGLHQEEELLAQLLDRSYRDSRNPLLLRRLGLLERALGRTEEANNHLEQAARLEQLDE